MLRHKSDKIKVKFWNAHSWIVYLQLLCAYIYVRVQVEKRYPNWLPFCVETGLWMELFFICDYV